MIQEAVVGCAFRACTNWNRNLQSTLICQVDEALPLQSTGPDTLLLLCVQIQKRNLQSLPFQSVHY